MKIKRRAQSTANTESADKKKNACAESLAKRQNLDRWMAKETATMLASEAGARGHATHIHKPFYASCFILPIEKRNNK